MKRLIAGLSIIGLIFTATAVATQPEQQPLVPEQVTGEFIAECGDFDVLADYRIEGYERFYFAKDGSLKRILLNIEFEEGIYYNSTDPSYWLAGSAEHTQRWIHFEDGMPTVFVGVGPYIKVTAPGYGTVFMGVGRYAVDLSTGEFLQLSGQHDIATGNFDALCAALRANP